MSTMNTEPSLALPRHRRPLSALLFLLPSLVAAAEPAEVPAEAAPAAPEAQPAAEPVAAPTAAPTPAALPADMQMTPGLGDSLPPPAPKATASTPETAAPANGAAENGKGGKVRVPYLSESQRSQIKDELRAEILDQARRENWAQPEQVPEWVRKIRFEGEVMARYERADFGNRNGVFVNYQEANRTGPINANTNLAPGQVVTIPTLNSSEDRDLPKLRAKLGVGYAVSEEVDLSMRFSTGNTINPVSNNQTVGTSFNKPSLVLDRAYIRYTPMKGLAVDIGRAPNLFATGTDLIWDRDLSFDGIGLRYRYNLAGEDGLRFASGFYSVENTDPNFPSNSILKNEGQNKWMWGSQIELRGDLFRDQMFRAGIGYFKFIEVEGERSSLCNAPTSSVPCDTDDTRPGFMQKGNTVFQIRNTQLANPGDPDYQFFGLSSGFGVLALSATWDMPLGGGIRLAADFDAARNLELDEDEIRARSTDPLQNNSPPDNNRRTCPTPTSPISDCPWDGGGDAWQAQLRVGNPLVQLRNDWQLMFGYRYVESDAVLDAFTDSDFHLGGTNAKGYYWGANWAFSRSAVLGTRYFGAKQVSSQRFAVDLLQLDVTVKF